MKVAEMELESLICESDITLCNDGFEKAQDDATYGSGLTKQFNSWDIEW